MGVKWLPPLWARGFRFLIFKIIDFLVSEGRKGGVTSYPLVAEGGKVDDSKGISEIF